MMMLTAILLATLCIALVWGQVRVVRRAFRDERAGIGRFTYGRDANPEMFWLILLVEITALVTMTVYLLGLAFAALR